MNMWQQFQDTVASINSTVNNIVWGVPAMALILGVGLFLTICTGCIQVRHFGTSMKETIGKAFKKGKQKKGSVSPFQALTTALAGTVGTGNIAGVAGAIAIGGPGAVFWMWVSAFFGMCTKCVEVILALRYREKNAHGDWVGGPMYYIKNGLGKKWKWLAVLFCVFGMLAMFGIGIATQVNSIVTSINTALAEYSIVESSDGNMTVNLIIGIAVGLITAGVLLGGIKRIGKVTEKLIPFMALLYIIMALGVVFINIKNVPEAFRQIFVSAFDPESILGGGVGSITMFMAMKKGIARGIFSNEAGLGTASIAHSSADNKEPVNQGLFGIFEVFADTIVICTLTALVILCSGITVPYGEAAGAPLTISGFTTTYGGWVSIICAVTMSLFAFSTTLGWGLYGSRCAEYLFGTKVLKPFMIAYSCVAILGAVGNLGLLWDIADTFNGLMAIPNLIAVALLSPVAVKLIRKYFKKPLFKFKRKG